MYIAGTTQSRFHFFLYASDRERRTVVELDLESRRGGNVEKRPRNGHIYGKTPFNPTLPKRQPLPPPHPHLIQLHPHLLPLLRLSLVRSNDEFK